MAQDQRRDPRIATRQKIWCEGQSAAAGETRDVSKSGMFIVAEEAPEVGTQFNVTFSDEGGDEMSLKMEVMWRGAKTEDNKTGMGVRIVGFDKGAEAYDRFLSRHARTNEGKSGQVPRSSVAAAPVVITEKASGER